MAVLYLIVSLKLYTKSTISKYLPSNLNVCEAIHNSVFKSPLMSIFRDSTTYAKCVQTTILRRNGSTETPSGPAHGHRVPIQCMQIAVRP